MKLDIKTKLQRELLQLSERAVKKNVRIAVTGLSGSGKSAFIASFINQMSSLSRHKHLPLFQKYQDGSILGGKLVSYDELHIPSFQYQEALNSIFAESPQWPKSTRGVSQARICVRYKVKQKFIRKIQAYSHLNIDIIDYPGEWLLDLPMLNMSFKQWSLSIAQWLLQHPQSSLAQQFCDSVTELKLSDFYVQSSVASISQEYMQFLLACKNSEHNIVSLQPGRFVLPGDLAGAPVLEFFPIIDKEILESDWSQLADNSFIRHLEERYNYYRDNIVKPFYKEYFSNVDRQILLIDAQKVLNNGYESYQEYRATISNIISNYNYGQSNWFKRLYKPTIDKLLIAATKVDHVPADQHQALQDFIDNMLISTETHVHYEGAGLETLTLSSICVTEQVLTKHDGKNLHCVQGIDISSDSKRKTINFPGKIPVRKLTKKEWKETDFNFISFAIPEFEQDKPLPHIRMDRAIDSLVGDLFV